MSDKPIDWTKPVETVDGRKVRILCTDGPEEYPIVGIIEDEVQTWTKEGEFHRYSYNSEWLNLRNVPEPPKEHTVTVELYRHYGGTLAVMLTTECRLSDAFNLISRKKITFKEGEGL